MAGKWKEMIFKVPSNLNYSVILYVHQASIPLITAISFALLNGREADPSSAAVRHSIKQYLPNSSVTQGSLECQAHCSASPTSFLLKGNTRVRVMEAFAHIPEL